MKIPKEIVDKVAQYDKLSKEANALYEELEEYFESIDDGVYYDGFSVVDEPTGDSQGDGEYCYQVTGPCEDSGNGTYYYPIEGSDKYIAIDYSF